MKENIRQMEELQRYTDAVIRETGEIISARKRIEEIQKNQLYTKQKFDKRLSELKKLKKETSSLELILEEADAAASRVKDKINSAQNEKELSAGSNELDKINSEKDIIEEQLLANFDKISEEEELIKKEEIIFEKNTNSDNSTLKELNERIDRLQTIKEENQKKFEAGLLLLEPKLRSRFAKLSESKDGKAIVKMENGVCMGCNNTVPPNDLSVVNSGELCICTNCGKYLYSGR
ncbi:MAG: hypothetical protein JXK07_05880 [Spirochaetes bacterium]|nr:hypothetical protein [Spirochaetota bacterium]MBN2771711.1 hypothetical protein [Spirochaetota bacterium]